MNQIPRRLASTPAVFQRGLGALAAVIMLVLLAGLAAAVVRLGWSSQMAMTQDLLSSRALHAANSGTEWGLYQAFKGGWTACSNASQTLDLRTDTGFVVTVTCNSTQYNEGQDASGGTQTTRIYTISAVACNSAGTCPDNSISSQATYVERERLVQATDRCTDMC